MYCKLSGLVTEADPESWTVDGLRPYAEVALEPSGAGRLMFGSDWPVSPLAAGYGAVLDAAARLTDGLSADERALVFGGTVRHVYQLKDSSMKRVHLAYGENWDSTSTSTPR